MELPRSIHLVTTSKLFYLFRSFCATSNVSLHLFIDFIRVFILHESRLIDTYYDDVA